MYCVVYRTGGTANFLWRRSAAVPTLAEAELLADKLWRAGYPAHVEVYAYSLSIGLPETFDAATPLPTR